MKIVIIGGIAAGMSAAAKARRVMEGGQVTVYEKGELISFGACGLPYFVGDFFQDEEYMLARSVEQMQSVGVDVKVSHQVLQIDPQQKRIKVKNLLTDMVFEDDYDRLMIATGADVIKPPFENSGLKNIFTLTKMQDGLKMKEAALSDEVKDVTVVGGGFIGVEVVEAMKNLGKKVRLIQRSDRIFNKIFDERITDLMQEELLAHDVELVLNEGVKGFEGDTSVTAIVTDKQRYETDLVVIATGFKPNTDFVKELGLNMLSNGAIIVDHRGETSIKDIYAAGDCASVPHIVKGEDVYLALATGANKLGRVAGSNMAGEEAYYPGSLGSACVKVMDFEAALTGLSEDDAIKLGVDYKTVFVKDKNHAGYYPGRENIYIKLVYDAKTRVILGGEILGKNGAALRIDVIAMAIKAKMTTEDLGMMDFCYAPPISKTWDALNVVGNVAK